jgi:hypothetical protein
LPYICRKIRQVIKESLQLGEIPELWGKTGWFVCENQGVGTLKF